MSELMALFFYLMSGLLKPKNHVLGSDLAGTVEAVGEKVDQFRPGDVVFGSARHGCFAEYVAVSEVVGAFAVQIAKWLGASVTGVCSTRNLEMLRSIGADRVVDYTREDFTQTGQRYDLIFDVVAKRSL